MKASQFSDAQKAFILKSKTLKRIPPSIAQMTAIQAINFTNFSVPIR